MNKRDLEALIPETVEQFIQAFPQSSEIIENTEIIILLNNNREARRREIYEKYGARFRDDEPNEGQCIFGYKGRAVIIYGSVIKSPKRFKRVLWHELGHIFTTVIDKELFIEAENDMNAWKDTLIRSGMALWSEYIAETIAYIVEDAEPERFPGTALFNIQRYMDEAVNEGDLSIYPLSFYYAMVFDNPTILDWIAKNDYVAPGLSNCDDEILPLIDSLMNVLGEQRTQENFVSISRSTLEKIGACIDALWDYCRGYGDIRQLLEKIISDNKKSES